MNVEQATRGSEGDDIGSAQVMLGTLGPLALLLIGMLGIRRETTGSRVSGSPANTGKKSRPLTDCGPRRPWPQYVVLPGLDAHRRASRLVSAWLPAHLLSADTYEQSV